MVSELQMLQQILFSRTTFRLDKIPHNDRNLDTFQKLAFQ